MLRRVASSWTLTLSLTFAVAAVGFGQEGRAAARGPRFLAAAWPSPTATDATDAPVLRRRVSLNLSGVKLGVALKELTRQADLEISYSQRIVPLNRTVSLHARGITVAAALTEILLDVPVDVSVTAGGALALVPRAGRLPWPPADSGAVAGEVRDSANGEPIAGATVSVDRTRHSATTDERGRYRIAGLPPGTYSVRARYIGYGSLAASVVVEAGREASLDFALARTAQPLEQVVVTGTLVPTQVKALPSPMTVIGEQDITLQRPHTLQELFRHAVPGAVSWDFQSAPYQTTFSARGATTFGPAGQMKVFVDGLEVTSPTYATVDPSSIERVEVIRGPQAAAIYGSDAIGGVMQIFTRRGDPSLQRPQVSVEAALGVVQTPYDGVGAALQQTYKAGIRGGASDVSYSLGAGYSHTGDYLPNGELSRQSNPSAYGGIRFDRGAVSVDISGRYYSQEAPSVVNPELAATGLAFYSRPFFQAIQVESQAISAGLTLRPTTWWQNSLTAGIDRIAFTTDQTQPRLTTPADTLLVVSFNSQQKRSIGFHSTVQAALGSRVSGSFVAGFDHYDLPNNIFYSNGALNTTGAIGPAGSISATRDVTNNSGYFGQGQVAFRDELFLTAGVRAEQNTNFGDSLGTPVSPRLGLAYVRGLGGATVKARGSWGRAIRAPLPGGKTGGVGQGQVFLANPRLGPERQQGWDGGIDLDLGPASLGVTYFRQTADNLIQAVLLPGDSQPTFQYQNVGKVRNSGVEVEAAVNTGPLTVKGQYGYTRARIEQLPVGYAGDLRVGDQASLVPRHTAGVSLTVSPANGTTVLTALTYVGSWRGTDFLALFRCFGGTGECRPTSRDYLVDYPSFAKLNLTVTQQFTRLVSAFLNVDNLTNNQAFEAFNITPVKGRVSTAGLRLQY
jgi:iron complex outermembrane receptor protein